MLPHAPRWASLRFPAPPPPAPGAAALGGAARTPAAPRARGSRSGAARRACSRARESRGRRLPAGFLFVSEVFSPAPLLLLRRPRASSPLCAPLPRRSGRPQSPPVPSGEFLDQVGRPVGRRGGEEAWEEGVGGQSGSGCRGRSWPGAGPPRGGGAPGKPPRGPKPTGGRAVCAPSLAGAWCGLPREAGHGVHQSAPGKAKDAGPRRCPGA